MTPGNGRVPPEAAHIWPTSGALFGKLRPFRCNCQRGGFAVLSVTAVELQGCEPVIKSGACGPNANLFGAAAVCHNNMYAPNVGARRPDDTGWQRRRVVAEEELRFFARWRADEQSRWWCVVRHAIKRLTHQSFALGVERVKLP